MERGQPGNELAELLWENGPALQWTAAPAPFPPFSCSAAGGTRAQELGKHPASATVVQDDHDDVPWLHYPIIGVDDGVTEYCGVLPQYYGNIDSTLVHVHKDVQTNRLRSTPLFTEKRTAWLQPPKESPAHPPPALPVPVRYAAELAAALPQRLQPDVRDPATTKTTSSVCSDNSDRSRLKRSSTGHMDLDDEAGGLRRSARRSTKRGRNAQVHNMSERRRRDRINDKMRALQELIPNCNKIDKASILEEAIEYLKTLQLQVQMMSTMGTAGLCVPPMLAMQHMQMTPMAHFHHHHLGAMGFGTGGFDLRLAGAMQFPYPMIPGVPLFHQAASAGSHMAAGTVTNNAAASQAEQTPSDHPRRSI